MTAPVTIQLPGIVHRFEKGHSLAVVTTGSGAVQELTVPVVGG